MSFKKLFRTPASLRLHFTPGRRSLTTEAQWAKRIFSGVQPTGALHIGNYLGAVKNWVNLQEAGENVTYCIVDMHSITVPQDPETLRENTMQMAATLLACGINPEKATLFQQSSVKQHTELGWILGCLTTMARLSHLPQYKEKSSQLKDIPLGLFIYPVLQAADILLYKSTHVPVGEDQVQHLQLAQHLAKLFNHKFGRTFPICHAMIADDASSRIKSLRDPTKKMSKSDPDPKSVIMLTDTPRQILEKVKKAITDFTPEVTYNLEERPGIANLLTIHSLMAGQPVDDICASCANIDTGKYKLQIAEAVITHLNPIRQKLDDYLKHPDYLEAVLKAGGLRASELAEQTMLEVKEKIGFSRNVSGVSVSIDKQIKNCN